MNDKADQRDVQIFKELYFLILKEGKQKGKNGKGIHDDRNFYNCIIFIIPRLLKKCRSWKNCSREQFHSFYCHDLYCNLYYELKICLFNISLKCIKYKHTVICYIMHLQVDIQMWETSVFMKEWPSYPTAGSPVYSILWHFFYFIHVPYENRTFISSFLASVLSIREGTKPSLCLVGCPASIPPTDLAMHLKLSICAQACAFVFLKCAFPYPNL